ncbi:hypothetical protein BC940DRAFT_333741 [Gongronella butleri]|nr:hypothetical protein BC940DRAFT_333741 [Gongronella butleri]
MSDRPRRKRQAAPRRQVSNVHYVGYVEDEESVEAIMKKFEELERIQKEFQAMQMQKPADQSDAQGEVTGDTSNDAGDQATGQQEQQEQQQQQQQTSDEKGEQETTRPNDDTTMAMTEEQLQEVFKRTSAFTVKSAMMDADVLDDMDAMELWQIEFKDSNTDEIMEEDDYIVVDDDFWDAEFGERPRKKGRRVAVPRQPRVPGQRRTPVDQREKILAKYKVMQVQMQDLNGHLVMVKKRVSVIDPSLPTYVRIPGNPIPLSWAHTILQMDTIAHKDPPPGSRAMEMDSILSTDLTTFGKKFTCVLMDPPLLLPGEAPSPGKITMDDLAHLNVRDVVPAGFLFIWIEKEWIRELVRLTKTWGFKYVENFCWIKKRINNQIARDPYRYVNKSKLSLLIFRKENDNTTDLRHQRNPDCLFDFVQPLDPDEISEHKPDFIYTVIETLLPTAIYHPDENPHGERLLELWAKRDQRRSGWTTLVERKK